MGAQISVTDISPKKYRVLQAYLTLQPAPLSTDLFLRTQVAPSAQAILTAGDPVKNARAILRNALPVDNKPIRKVARELESISEALRIPGSKAFGPVARSVRSAEGTFTNQLATITKAFAADKKQDGLESVEQLKLAFKTLDAAVEAKDKSDIFAAQQVCLQYVGQIQEAMVTGFPFEVCSEGAMGSMPPGCCPESIQNCNGGKASDTELQMVCRCQKSTPGTHSCSAELL